MLRVEPGLPMEFQGFCNKTLSHPTCTPGLISTAAWWHGDISAQSVQTSWVRCQIIQDFRECWVSVERRRLLACAPKTPTVYLANRAIRSLNYTYRERKITAPGPRFKKKFFFFYHKATSHIFYLLNKPRSTKNLFKKFQLCTCGNTFSTPTAHRLSKIASKT